LLGVELVRTRECVQRAVDLFKIPWIVEIKFDPAHPCFGRYGLDVAFQEFGKRSMLRLIEKLHTFDQKIFVSAERNRRTPFLQTLGPFAAVEVRPDQSDDDPFFFRHLSAYRNYSKFLIQTDNIL